MKLSIVAPCFWGNESEAIKLTKSCVKHNLDLKLYGLQQDFINARNGQGVKLLEFLNTIDSEIVFITDAFDSWMLKGEATILRRFKSYNCDILVSGERDMYPLLPKRYKYPRVSTSFKYINGGQMMGYRTKMIQALEHLLHAYDHLKLDNPEHLNNSQTLWHLIYIEGKHNIKVDDKCKLFLAMNHVELDEISYRNGELILKETQTSPCSIHFNGPKSDSPMNKMWGDIQINTK